MLKVASKFFYREKGASLVETAIALPILIVLIAGIFEIGMYILLQSKLTRMAGVITDAVTRQNLSRPALVGIMDSAYNITNPFDFERYGQMVVSQVRNTALNSNPNQMVISWQQNKNGGHSRLGSPGSFPQNLPGGITVINEQTMVITEVFYEYVPLVFGRIIPARSIYKTAVFVPRSGSMNTLLGE